MAHLRTVLSSSALLRSSLSPLSVRAISSTSPVLSKKVMYFDRHDGKHVDQHAHWSKEEDETRPVALVIGWLGSNHKQIARYNKMLHDCKMDTVSLFPGANTILNPNNAVQLAHKLLHKLNEGHLQHRPIVLYAFSIGGYMSGTIIQEVRKHAEKFESIAKRLRCQVFDSIVNVDRIPQGVSHAFYANNPIMRTAVHKSLETFLKFHPAAPRLYAVSNQFIQDPFTVPSLFMFSKDDVVANHNDIEDCMNLWKSRGIHVQSCSWDRSKHVLHYRDHPEQYAHALTSFLSKHALLDHDAPAPIAQHVHHMHVPHAQGHAHAHSHSRSHGHGHGHAHKKH